MRVMKLLVPGLRIKRWLGLTLLGLVVLALGLAYLFVELYRTVALPMEAAYLTLQFVPRWLRGADLRAGRRQQSRRWPW